MNSKLLSLSSLSFPHVHQVDLDPRFVNMADLYIIDLSTKANVSLTPINVEQTHGSDWLLQSEVRDEVCLTLPSPYDNDYRGADPLNPEDAPNRFNPDKPVFAILPDGNGYALYDPRLILHENTLDSPAMDGGGNTVVRSSLRAKTGFEAQLAPDGSTYYVFNDKNIALCNNEEPNFLNQDTCTLSYEPNACIAEELFFHDIKLVFTFNKESLAAVFNTTLASYTEANATSNITAVDSSRYVYAVSNLRYDNSNTDGALVKLPCMAANPKSRWIPRSDINASNCINTLQNSTVQALKQALETSNDENPYLRDIVLWNIIDSDGCHADDLMTYGMLIMTEEGCWENVHPNYM